MNQEPPLTPSDYRPHASPAVRWLLIAAGTVCVALGVIGVFTPVLPTTPFMLLAAACYARSSERFYRRLVGSPTFGPTIIEWQRHRSIPYRTKIYAIVLMSATLGTSIIFFVANPWLQAALALMGVSVVAWMWRIPSRDRLLRPR
jgi:uncharacterized membrane protein YbaN (DUF454 family)